MNISNRDIRKLWLNTMGLSSAPTGKLDVLQIIKDLGFVQLDTIQNVSRAHHHILWSRNQNYREHMFDDLLSAKGNIFEHFTHDASVIPVEFYPMWTRKFGRLKKWADGTKRYQELLAYTDIKAIKARITKEGALSTAAFSTKRPEGKKMWSRPPHKIALDYMWYAGELATSHRDKFKKFYDLSERVIPKHILEQSHNDSDQINWLCEAALDRLSFATLKEVQKFWDATDLCEVKNWHNNHKSLIPIKWQTDDGNWTQAIAPHDIEDRINALSKPTSRLRIINPFDPAIRDRTRLKQMFGFDYKIEIFVPASKRKWGYYVYPLLEGARFVGRIELKSDRKKGQLNVINFWQEDGTKWGPARFDKLETELGRFASLANLTEVNSNFLK